MKSPKLAYPIVDPLTVAEVRALLLTCQPVSAEGPETPRSLRHIRDEASIRLMA